MYRSKLDSPWDRAKLSIWRVTARQDGFVCGDLSEPNKIGEKIVGIPQIEEKTMIKYKEENFIMRLINKIKSWFENEK